MERAYDAEADRRSIEYLKMEQYKVIMAIDPNQPVEGGPATQHGFYAGKDFS